MFCPLETNTQNIMKQNKRFTRLKISEAEYVSIWEKQQHKLKIIKPLNRNRVKSNFYDRNRIHNGPRGGGITGFSYSQN